MLENQKGAHQSAQTDPPERTLPTTSTIPHLTVSDLLAILQIQVERIDALERRVSQLEGPTIESIESDFIPRPGGPKQGGLFGG